MATRWIFLASSAVRPRLFTARTDTSWALTAVVAAGWDAAKLVPAAATVPAASPTTT